MAENLCKNCKYWTRNTDQHDDSHLGKCSSEKFVYTGDLFSDIKVPNDGFSYTDYENYKASFETGENFGCIHFESKVKENG